MFRGADALPGADGGPAADTVPSDMQTDPGSVADGMEHRAAEVERLPLTDRADAFATLHDELRTRLEQGGDTRA